MTDPNLVCVADFEEKAAKILEKSTYDYYRSGAGDEHSLSLNRESFRKLRLRPRCLRDVSNVSLELEILGQTVSWPLGISPSAMQRLAHDDGEVANARAAGEAGSIFILGTLATTSIEEVAEKAPNTTKWFQLYIYKDRAALTEKLVRRAERANFKAIVLTIDSPIFGQRRSEARNNFKLPDHLSLANFANVGGGKGAENFNAYVLSQFDASVTWRDVEWLINFTKLPVIVKGVLTAEDAVLAKEHGCAGIIVSNHGARHLDYVPASIEALPEIVRAVGRDYLVMLDGGITQGNDMFKALALGAKMVFVGRSALWGLACGGQQGVEQLLAVLRRDFEMTLKLMGCAKLIDITPAMVAHESSYAKL